VKKDVDGMNKRGAGVIFIAIAAFLLHQNIIGRKSLVRVF